MTSKLHGSEYDKQRRSNVSARPASEPAPQTAATEFASPVCYANEVDPAYFGYMTDAELVELLNTLLEAEQAGARVTAAWELESSAKPLRHLLGEVKQDTARFSALLTRLVRRHAGIPSRATGGFYEQCMAMKAPLAERVAFLNCGQTWVIRRLRDALPRIHDEQSYLELKSMLNVQEANVTRRDEKLAGLSP